MAKVPYGKVSKLLKKWNSYTVYVQDVIFACLFILGSKAYI